MIIVLFIISTTFDFMNGMRDASNFVSMMISTHAIPFRWALILTAIAEFSGPFLIGTNVAVTFSSGLIDLGKIHMGMLMAALISASIWNIITLILKIPSSSTHALFGGILGAVFAGADLQALHSAGMIKILVGLMISPVLGFIVSYFVTKLVYILSFKATPSINNQFRKAQVLTGITLAVSYGANDAQKSMGITSMALFITGYLNHFYIPAWVMAVSAGATALGIGIGGWRLVGTLGRKFYKTRPVHGFTSQLSSVMVILTGAFLGAPISTSQAVTAAILGTGSAERRSMVRWNVAGQIVFSWLITIPVCAVLGNFIYDLLMMSHLVH